MYVGGGGGASLVYRDTETISHLAIHVTRFILILIIDDQCMWLSQILFIRGDKSIFNVPIYLNFLSGLTNHHHLVDQMKIWSTNIFINIKSIMLQKFLASSLQLNQPGEGLNWRSWLPARAVLWTGAGDGLMVDRCVASGGQWGPVLGASRSRTLPPSCCSAAGGSAETIPR